MVLGPDGNMWFAWTKGIGRINTATGQIQFVVLGAFHADAIAFGADGNLWFIDSGANRIGRVTASRLPFAAPVAPKPNLRAPAQKLSTVRRQHRMTVDCSLPAAGRCSVQATITAKLARSLKLKPPKKAKLVSLARASTTLRKKGTARLTLKFSAAAVKALARTPSIRIQLIATSSLPKRKSGMSKTTLTLRG